MIMTKLTPAIFFGHGNPMNAIGQNAYTAGWSRLGQTMSRPRAILSISAHWYVPETGVTITTAPRTIHDFGGFPPATLSGRISGSRRPRARAQVQQLLAPLDVKLDHSWGLDHGTWSVLKHVYPAADIPVVQLSIDETKPASVHFEIGKKLAPLRDEGVLIVGSGNLVHNLHAMPGVGIRAIPTTGPIRFEARAKDLILARKFASLIDYEELGSDATLSIPTPDHYLPLLYVLSTGQATETAGFPINGVDGGSISVLTVKIG